MVESCWPRSGRIRSGRRIGLQSPAKSLRALRSLRSHVVAATQPCARGRDGGLIGVQCRPQPRYRKRSAPSIARTRGGCWRRSSACSATSTSPRRRCTTRSAPRSSNGRAKACRPIRGPGWCRPAGSRRSTASAAARASTRSTTTAPPPTSRSTTPPAWADEESVEDDRLRLIFTCCHPALAPDAQVALTLREVCGLTTEEIARAFLTPAPTLAQRIVRAKAKIRDARIPVSGADARRAARAARRGAARRSISCSTKATPRRRARR